MFYVRKTYVAFLCEIYICIKCSSGHPDIYIVFAYIQISYVFMCSFLFDIFKDMETTTDLSTEKPNATGLSLNFVLKFLDFIPWRHIFLDMALTLNRFFHPW